MTMDYMQGAYGRSRPFSDSGVEKIRGDLRSCCAPHHAVVCCGSYARGEASVNSDLDYFLICPQGDETEEASVDARLAWQESVRKVVGRHVPKPPSEDGAFDNIISKDELLSPIGGPSESNKVLTRRILFLLEGKYLFGEDIIRSIRKEILEKYIKQTITDHQLALFFLNDIIKFYRTMAVDFENKTGEGEKPWGVRNIKLVYSRKLLYASGLFSVGMTADLRRDRKVSILEDLLDLTPIDRMKSICRPGYFDGVFKRYNVFLEKLEDRVTRERLDRVKEDDRSDPEYRDLKNDGHLFSRDLFKLFEDTFSSEHPIRRLAIF